MGLNALVSFAVKAMCNWGKNTNSSIWMITLSPRSWTLMGASLCYLLMVFVLSLYLYYNHVYSSDYVVIVFEQSSHFSSLSALVRNPKAAEGLHQPPCCFWHGDERLGQMGKYLILNPKP